MASADTISVIAHGAAATSPAGFTMTAEIVVSSSTGPPTTMVTVSGTGFGVGEGVDVIFDTTGAALAGADGTGSFGPITVTVPASTTPGTHSISAEGRQSMLFAQAAFTVATNWPQFRDQPGHHGHNGTENVLSPATVSGMDLDWSFATGPTSSSPAVANGMVYVGSNDNNVYALDATTGALQWSFATGNGVSSSPAVANGVVYVGSADNNVYALDAATGALQWSFATGGDVYSSPAVANGVVYVGSVDNNLYAIGAATGFQLWYLITGGPVNSSPAVADGVVYVGSSDGNVYALDHAAGGEQWRFAATGGVNSSPAVANGVLYVGSAEIVYAIDVATGVELWSYLTGGTGASSPAVANGVVYVGSVYRNIYAFGLANMDT
jgi:outer membrane protein assembly factor BamB